MEKGGGENEGLRAEGRMMGLRGGGRRMVGRMRGLRRGVWEEDEEVEGRRYGRRITDGS